MVLENTAVERTECAGTLTGTIDVTVTEGLYGPLQGNSACCLMTSYKVRSGASFVISG